MKIARLRLERFSGFGSTIIIPSGHVVLVGEPGAGRSDTMRALRRVLSPRSTAAGIDPLDVHRPAGAQCQTQATQLTEVEVTLTDLGAALEQRFDPYLERLTHNPECHGSTETDPSTINRH